MEFHRRGRFDATITLHDGRSFGVVRQGLALRRRSLYDRLRAIAEYDYTRRPDTVLILVPSVWEERLTTRFCEERNIRDCYVGVEYSYLAPLVEPPPGRRLKPVNQLWPKAGRLLVGARFRLNTVRVVSMRADTNVLGSMWWPVRVDDPTVEKALTVWLNSSLGLLTLMAVRNTTQGGWVQLKKADLEELPVLDTRSLSPKQLKGLSDVFNEMTEAEFERLPGMAHCPARQALDSGVSRILGLPDLSKLRDLLASEPVISNRRL